MKKLKPADIDAACEKLFKAPEFGEKQVRALMRAQPELTNYLVSLCPDTEEGEHTTDILFKIFHFLTAVLTENGIAPHRPDDETIAATEEFIELELASLAMESGKNKTLFIDKFERAHPQPELVAFIVATLPKPEEKGLTLDLFHMATALFTTLNCLCGLKPPKIAGRAEWGGIRDLKMTEPGLDHMGRASRKHKFTSIEQANAYLKNNFVGTKTERVPPATPLEAAQDLIYKAMETRGHAAKAELARAALKVCPDCADAYNLLAEQEEDYAAAGELYEKAMEAAERALGKKFFAENEGSLWSKLAARPYMRARLGLAISLWDQEKLAGAEANFYALLRLNKSDNQGVRYTLMQFHAKEGEWEKADALINSGAYPDDCAADWLYTKALAAYATKKPGAGSFLAAAISTNPFAPEYLLGAKPVPRRLPDKIGMGDESEGLCYAADFLDCWKQVPGALEWLGLEAAKGALPKLGRNEPCPCGSGRKFKKCCGQHT